MSTLPGGTVTFVFTDIEGSTRLLQELGDEAYGRVSGDHRRLVREAFAAHGGTASPKTLKTQSPKSRQEDMASRFEERITTYVEKQLESAFDEHGTPQVPKKLAFGGAAIGLGVLLMLAVVVVAIVLLVKVAFF